MYDVSDLLQYMYYMIVWVDLQGPMEVARLFGINAVQQVPLGQNNARTSQHYRSSITSAFNRFPVRIIHSLTIHLP